MANLLVKDSNFFKIVALMFIFSEKIPFDNALIKDTHKLLSKLSAVNCSTTELWTLCCYISHIILFFQVGYIHKASNSNHMLRKELLYKIKLFMTHSGI